jgi:hypothetical protein
VNVGAPLRTGLLVLGEACQQVRFQCVSVVVGARGGGGGACDPDFARHLALCLISLLAALLLQKKRLLLQLGLLFSSTWC